MFVLFWPLFLFLLSLVPCSLCHSLSGMQAHKDAGTQRCVHAHTHAHTPVPRSFTSVFQFLQNGNTLFMSLSHLFFSSVSMASITCCFFLLCSFLLWSLQLSLLYFMSWIPIVLKACWAMPIAPGWYHIKSPLSVGIWLHPAPLPSHPLYTSMWHSPVLFSV